ncbi:universal stress protein [Methylobacterium durans]|uniref:universal stress protein n=1 Tax=Methylobacterium durans TaxID=2202825 RepID=UPI002B0027B3|nr:universal stress protein [Methylobacterium durans]MEA1832515.1 universal stress protein [Methylobacterium durans]
MTYASFAVSLDPGATTADRVQLAADLARRFEVTLTGVAARCLPAPIAVNDIRQAEALYAEEEARLREELARVKAAFETNAAGAETDWRSAAGGALTLLIECARASDLILIGRRGAEDPDPGDMGVMPGPVLMEAGRPVLIVPPGLERLEAARIVVAWKDTVEARRAISGALPFIRRADRVFVATAGSGARFEGAEDVARFLARHGAHATTHLLARPAVSDADEILRFAQRQDADLLVMGAYGHSRLREWIFGGATRDILQTTPICSLMAH